MEQKQDQVVEAEYTEVEESKTDDGVKIAAEIKIQIMSNGEIGVNVSEEYEKLNTLQIENFTKSVYEQLHDQRIAEQAVQILKAKLG